MTPDPVLDAVVIALRVRSKETSCASTNAAANAPARCIAKVTEHSGDLECPACGSTKLTWAYRFQKPDFKFGELICLACKKLFDVTPRN